MNRFQFILVPLHHGSYGGGYYHGYPYYYPYYYPWAYNVYKVRRCSLKR